MIKGIKDTRISKECISCGVYFKIHKSDADKRVSCSMKCRPKNVSWNKGNIGYQSGTQHYKWIKDRTQVKQYWTERNNPVYKQWRQSVWLRDNFKCKIANPDCNGKIEVHHILRWSEYPELRYEINNGITLCHAHHPRKVAEEKRLAPKFKELVSVSKQ